MKNIKLIKADFDRETGISTVIINTDIGKFEGINELIGMAENCMA